ncbi:MAG: cytochrome c3 family protein, partial [Myxococcota bacterium]
MKAARRALLAALGLAASARAVDPPHDPVNLPNTCEDCHIAHNASGLSLTTVAGNANLCITCHATKGLNWAAADQAVPGTSGSSHRWDGLATNASYGVAEPINQSLLTRLYGYTSDNPNKKVICSTCHNQHTQANVPVDPTAPAYGGAGTGRGRHFQRIANTADAMCTDCHRSRDVTQTPASDPRTYSGSALSHRVKMAIPAASTFFSPPRDLADYGTATAGAATTLTDSGKAWVGGALVGRFVTFKSGANANVTREITANTATQLTFDLLASAIVAGVTYEISGAAQVAVNVGTATSGSLTTLNDTSKAWGAGTLVGQVIRFTSAGANKNVTRVLTGNTATQVSWVGNLPAAVVAGNTYEIDADGNLTNNAILTGGYASGNVLCSSCHAPHYADSNSTTYDEAPSGGDGNLLRRSNNDAACVSCHKMQVHSSNTTSTKYGSWGLTFNCKTCHDPHGSKNLYLFNESVTTPNSGVKTVDFRVRTGGSEAFGLANSNANASGPCEVCHTQTRNGALVSSPGTASFTAGGTAVSGAGTTWTSQLAAGWELRRQGDPASAWTPIATVNSNISLTLVAGGYRGTTGAGSTWEAANPRYRNTDSGSGAGTTHNNGTRCTTCHKHENGFKAGESGGNTKCSTCHGFDMLVSDVNRSTVYHHVLETDVRLDAVFGTTIYPTAATPTAATGDEDKTCVQCHADHNVFNPALNPANSIGRAANLRSRIANASVPGQPPNDSSGYYWNKDRESTFAAGGICLSCHTNAQTKNTTDQKSDGTTQTAALVAADFQASAHGFAVGGTAPTTQFTTDSSSYAVACVKCHASDDATTKQNGTYQFMLHSSVDRRLRFPMGMTSPVDAMEEDFCFRCHHTVGDSSPGGGPAKGTANQDYYGVQAMSASAQALYGMLGTSSTRTLYLKSAADENPSLSQPNAYQNTGTYDGDTTYVRRFMSPAAGTTEESIAKAILLSAISPAYRFVQFVSPPIATGF